MKPWRNLSGLSVWVMRVAIMLVVFAGFFDTFMHFNLKVLQFYFAAGFVVFGILLFVAGFLSKHSLTVISGLVLLILSVIQAYFHFDGINSGFAFWLLMSSVSLYFVTNGNK